MHNLYTKFVKILEICKQFSKNLVNEHGNMPRRGPVPKFSDLEVIMSMKSIYEMLASLTDTNKKWLADHLYQDIADKNVKNKREAVSDEELAARLSQFPSWDEMEPCRFICC